MAYDFDGSNDAISLGNSSTLNPTALSISVWGNIDNLNNPGVSDWFFCRDDNALGRSFSFGSGDAGSGHHQLRLQINGAATLAGGTDLSSLTGVWTHFAMTGTSGNWNVYLNGVSDGSNATVTTPASTTGATTIGQRTYSGFEGFTDGRLAEVGFWGAVLDASEIAALAKGYSPSLIRPGSLLSHVPLVRNLIDFRGAAPSLVDSPTAGFAHPRIIYPKRRAA